MIKLNKKNKKILFTVLGAMFFFYSCFKDRPHIEGVRIDNQIVHYATPYRLSKDQKEFSLYFELDAKKYLKQYSITITEGTERYNPNVKNIRATDGLRGRRTEFLDGEQKIIQLHYQDLKLHVGKYEGEILVGDLHGYQTRFTFTLQVE
jgi:hypothetical protein